MVDIVIVKVNKAKAVKARVHSVVATDCELQNGWRRKISAAINIAKMLLSDIRNIA
jgi:hypothetical protein